MTFDPTEARARLDALTGYTPGPWVAGERLKTADGKSLADLRYSACNPETARLIAAAPDLAAGYRAALDENARLTAENARLRDLIADFAANDFERIRSRPVSGHPADEVDDMTPLGTVQAWQDDARAALEAHHD